MSDATLIGSHVLCPPTETPAPNLASPVVVAGEKCLPGRPVSRMMQPSNSRDEEVMGERGPHFSARISIAFLHTSSASSYLHIPLLRPSSDPSTPRHQHSTGATSSPQSRQVRRDSRELSSGAAWRQNCASSTECWDRNGQRRKKPSELSPLQVEQCLGQTVVGCSCLLALAAKRSLPNGQCFPRWLLCVSRPAQTSQHADLKPQECTVCGLGFPEVQSKGLCRSPMMP